MLNDTGLLHATLASWALYGMLANEHTDLRVCKLKHKNEAIKAVNCKLAVSGGYISDEVVGTVLTLANLEVLSKCSLEPVHANRPRIFLETTMQLNFT